MTLLPGSLDHLYYKGLLDYFQTDVYSSNLPMPYYGNYSQYNMGLAHMNNASRFDHYINSNPYDNLQHDTFVNAIPRQGVPEKSFREQILDAANLINDKNQNDEKKKFVKSFLALSILAVTFTLLGRSAIRKIKSMFKK